MKHIYGHKRLLVGGASNPGFGDCSFAPSESLRWGGVEFRGTLYTAVSGCVANCASAHGVASDTACVGGLYVV